MDVKKFLKETIELNRLIEYRLEQIKELWSSMIYPSGGYEPQVQSSKNFNKRTDQICQMIELENEVKAMQAELRERQETIKQLAEKLDNQAMTEIIIKRYIEFKSWNKIIEETNRSRRWTMELHGRAIKKMTESQKNE